MFEQRTDMDSIAEPIVQAETPPSEAGEKVTQDDTHSTEAVEVNSVDEDDAILARLLDDVDSDDGEADVDSSTLPHVEEKPVIAFDRDAVAKILKRDGVPDEVISSASPETLAKWAESAAKRQKDVDSYGSRMKQLEEQVTKGAQQNSTVQDNTPAPAETPASADPFAQMAAVYGDDVVSPVRMAFQQQQAQMQEQLLLAQTRAADVSLRVQYGAKAPSYDAVLAKMSELGAAKPGGYASVDELAAAAYSAIVGSKPSAPVNQRASQPTAPKGGPAPVKPPPRDEDDDILDQIISGGNSRLRPATRK
jgi:hypothetical protein